MIHRTAPALLVGLCLLTTPAASADPSGSQAVLYSGAINDGSYNESASRGVRRFEEERGASIRTRVLPIGEDVRAVVDRLAAAGTAHFVALGGWWSQQALVETARELPQVRFTVIDAGDLEGGPPNLAAVAFREEEVAAMAGVAAGSHSRSGRLGFVGGMPIPSIRRFCGGFLRGARAVDPDVLVEAVYVDPADPRGFRDRETAHRLTAGLLDRGVDVVFGAAGISTLGVLRAAAEREKLAIGVDVNQNGLHPGHVLTSAIKRVDIAVHGALTDFAAGGWQSGFRRYGLAEGYLELAVDEHNRELLAPLEGVLDRVRTELEKSGFEPEPEIAAAICG